MGLLLFLAVMLIKPSPRRTNCNSVIAIAEIATLWKSDFFLKSWTVMGSDQ